MIFVSNQEAREKLKEWQTLLGLSDWDIDIGIVRRHEMVSSEFVRGEINFGSNKRIANIRLLEPNDFHNAMRPLDHEVTLVHELLHIHFRESRGQLHENEADEWGEERAIDAIAKALVTLKRQIGTEAYEAFQAAVNEHGWSKEEEV